MSDNSWIEKCEKPPIGWHGECTYGARVAWRECVILPRNKIAIFGDNFQKIEQIENSYHFRPIKTDRELAIEAALKVFSVGIETDKLLFTMAGALFDAGLLRSKDES